MDLNELCVLSIPIKSIPTENSAFMLKIFKEYLKNKLDLILTKINSIQENMM